MRFLLSGRLLRSVVRLGMRFLLSSRFLWPGCTAWNMIFALKPFFATRFTAWNMFFAPKPTLAARFTAWNAFFALRPYFDGHKSSDLLYLHGPDHFVVGLGQCTGCLIGGQEGSLLSTSSAFLHAVSMFCTLGSRPCSYSLSVKA